MNRNQKKNRINIRVSLSLIPWRKIQTRFYYLYLTDNIAPTK